MVIETIIEVIKFFGVITLIVNLILGLSYFLNYYNYKITLLNGIKTFLFCPLWIFHIFFIFFKERKRNKLKEFEGGKK